MRFIWDAENVVHIARHDVTPIETEDVITSSDTIIIPARSNRWSAYGLTAAGRPLRVIFDMSPERVRVTTAYPIRRRVLDRIRQEAQT